MRTRARLLRATLKLVAERGAEALSLKDAAKVANVSRAAAYQHFRDRDHLLHEVKSGISDLLVKFSVDMPPGSVEERMYRAAVLILQNMEASKLVVMDALANKGLKSDHPLYKLLLRNLKELRSSGRGRRDLDVEMSTFILLGGVCSIIMLGRHYGLKDIEGLAGRFSRAWNRQLREGIFTKRTPRNTKRRRPGTH
jgi:AcrR family transcriptional regulator